MPVPNDWSAICQQVHDWLQGWHWKSESCQQVGPAWRSEAEKPIQSCGIYLGNVNLYVVRSQEVAWAIFVAGLQDALLSQQVLWLHINRLDDHVRACLQEQATALHLACCLKDPTQACPNPSSSADSDTDIDWHVYFPIIFIHLPLIKRWPDRSIRHLPNISNGHGGRNRLLRRLNFNSQAAAKAKPKASAKAKAAAPTAGEPDGTSVGRRFYDGKLTAGSYQIGKIETGNSFFGNLYFLGFHANFSRV